ncbi:MAG: TetR/AcrR family transcriptional regulator [Oscillospiraceae bacterium]|nr:TetR/AcrR family transcriptional regulator [Oscillospiraceae bacterium]
MRITKDADERRSEILDISQRLFHEKGYSETTVEDIITECKIAKGTLYYYFKSKEDILSAIIDRQIDENVISLTEISIDSSITATEKLVKVIRLLSQSGVLDDSLHDPDNSELHQKTFKRSLLRYTDVLTKMVNEGISSGEFSTPYPEETVQLLFCSSQLYDPGVFKWSEEERYKKVKAFFYTLEVTLGISPKAKEQLYRVAGIKKEW